MKSAYVFIATILLSLFLGCSPEVPTPPPGIRWSHDYPSIQAAIDVGPGNVYLPPGKHEIDAPLRLPRTDLLGNGVVKLIGSGQLVTYIVPSATFQGDSLITWVDADPGAGNVKRRAWGQWIEGMTLSLPKKDAKGIWYKRTLLDKGPEFEKMVITIKDVGCMTYNTWQQTCIKLEGNVHDAVIQDVVNDVGVVGGVVNYDSMTLEVDTGKLDDGNDNWGMYSARIEGLEVTPRSGGYGSLFKGRCLMCTFNDLKVGKGSQVLPGMHFTYSNNVFITNLVMEGRTENPQVLFENSRMMTLTHFSIGTPDYGNWESPFGNGIELKNCFNCTVDTWVTYPNKVLWDKNRGVKRIVLDANTKASTVNIIVGGGQYGHEDMVSIVEDLGTGNCIRVQSVSTLAKLKNANCD